MIVVRPDQYVAHVLPLDAHDELTDFFAGILVEAAHPWARHQTPATLAAAHRRRRR